MRTAARLSVLLLGAAAACGGTQPADDDDGNSPDGPRPPDAATPDARQPDAPLPDGLPMVDPAIDGRLVINEVMATNALTIKDSTGMAGDWFEIYNPTEQDLSLAGYAVTDDLAVPLKFQLGAITVPAGGHLMLWADDREEVDATHVGFKLEGMAGTLALARPDGTFIDRVSYAQQETDFSAARSPDGSTEWKIVWNVTPGAPNAAGEGTAVGLEDPTAPPEAIPAAGDLSEHFLGYDEMPRLEILVSPAGVAQLETQPFVYVPGTLVFEGRMYGPVGVRCKGQNSFLPFSQKPSLRINVSEYDLEAKFWGLKDLTLNNMSGDFSMMHERLAYLVMREAGVPASRANHLLLTVNGQFYGLYNNLETVKKKMVGRWFTDSEGPLFEATDVDFVANYISRYELESGPDDRSLLSGLAAALTMPSADAAMTGAGAFVDMNRFRRFWAVASVIAQFDSFPYSMPGDDYYVYADPTSSRLSFMPWGMDETFYSGQIDVTNVSSVLARRCKESPACFQAYQAEVWEVQALTEEIDLLGERERVMAQIAPYVQMDTRKPYTNEIVAESQGHLYWFISERRSKLNAMFSPPPPP